MHVGHLLFIAVRALLALGACLFFGSPACLASVSPSPAHVGERGFLSVALDCLQSNLSASPACPPLHPYPTALHGGSLLTLCFAIPCASDVSAIDFGFGLLHPRCLQRPFHPDFVSTLPCASMSFGCTCFRAAVHHLPLRRSGSCVSCCSVLIMSPLSSCSSTLCCYSHCWYMRVLLVQLSAMRRAASRRRAACCR